jgi:hypothetical protein
VVIGIQKGKHKKGRSGWTNSHRFDGLGEMAIPSANSPKNFVTPKSNDYQGSGPGRAQALHVSEATLRSCVGQLPSNLTGPDGASEATADCSIDLSSACNKYHYTDNYKSVRRYVQRHRLERRETFIPLEHSPGYRLEANLQQSGANDLAATSRLLRAI